MLKKISIGLLLVVIAFLAYVSTRPSKFNYERSGVIHAPKERIFPYLSDFKLAEQWSPYEKMDPEMKKTYQGQDGEMGAKMEFAGKKSGSGTLEIVKLVPGESVQLHLHMTAPMSADNLIEYKLTPEDDGTRFTWSMSGDGGFLGKLVSVFIDCEKMITGQFDQGIANLKAVVEGQSQK